MLRFKGLFAAIILSLGLVLPVARAESPSLYKVEVSHAGAAALQALKAERGVSWWIELGDLLVVAGTPETMSRAARRFTVTPIEGPSGDELLFVGHRAHGHGIESARVLAASGVFALVAASPDTAAEIDEHEPGSIQPLQRNYIYARSVLNDASPPRALDKSHKASAYADAVDVARWRETVGDLVAFGTRYTGTDGARAARDYIVAEFAEIGIPATVRSVAAGGQTAYNVVAEIRGTTRPGEVYIVCGHYDSISEQPDVSAPGAEDNASGTAGVLELARVFAADPPEATVRFICFSGEEQGLYGSRAYVDDLVSSGEAARIKAAINMDMIAFSGDEELDVLLETGAVGRDLADALAAAAQTVTALRVVKSFNPFGSDHVPFIQAGIPSVLTIENDWDDYPDYHTSRDTMENVRDDMGGAVLRMNAAALATLAAGDGGSGTAISVSVPLATNRKTIYGGFTQTIAWTVSGTAAESFDVEYSLDGGATWVSIVEGLGPDARSYVWTVPEDAQTNRGAVRVVAHFEGATTDLAVSPGKLKLRSTDGPFIKAVKFKESANFDFYVKGRLPGEVAQILVDDRPIPATSLDSRFVDGNTAKRVFGSVEDLEAFFPAGVPVRVRVEDPRTGLSTPEFVVTR